MTDYNSPVLEGILPQLQNLSDDEKQQLVANYQANFNDPKENGNALIPWQGASLKDIFKGLPASQATSDQMPTGGLTGPPAPSDEELKARREQSVPLPNLVTSLGKKAPDIKSDENYKAPTVGDLISKLNQPDPDMLAAQANRNQLQLFSMLGKAGNMVLGGQTHTRPDNAVYDQLGTQAGQGISDLQNKQAMMGEKLKQQDLAQKLVGEQTKADPASDISKTYRAMAEEMIGRKLPEGMSAADLEKISPIFEKMFAAKQAALDRQNKLDQVNAFREKSLNSRIENQASNRFDKNVQDFTTRLEGAKRFTDIIDEINSGRIVDTNSLSRTLSTDLSNLVGMNKTGGAYGDREEYAIFTFQTLLSKLGQFAGKPISSIPKEYLDQLELEGKLLKNDYIDTYKRKTKELEAGTQFEAAKNVFRNRSKSFLDQYDKSSNNSKSHPDDQSALKYAQEHPEDPDSASILSILKQKGIK